MNAPKLQPFLRQLRSVRTSFLLACAAGWWLPSAAAEPTTPISILNLELSPQKFEALENDKGSNETIDARMTWRSLTNLPVKIRNRGRWSRSWNKSPLKIFLPSNPVENRDCLNLNSTYRDASWIRERLAYHVYQSCGVPASKTRFVEVRHNGNFHGAYVEVEQVDSKFLTQRTLKGAELYKAIGRGAAGDERRLPNAAAYQREYEKQTKDKSDYQSLVQFCSELHSATNTDAFFNTHVDLDRYINYLAAGILIQNWDSLNKNHVLARLPGKDAKWFVIPWDVDRTLGDRPETTGGGAFNYYKMPLELGIQSSPGITGWNRLQNRFWQSKTLRERLAKRLEELLANEFTPARLFPLLDSWAAEIRPLAAKDLAKWGSTSNLNLDQGIQEVKGYIENRRSYVAANVARLRD